MNPRTRKILTGLLLLVAALSLAAGLYLLSPLGNSLSTPTPSPVAETPSPAPTPLPIPEGTPDVPEETAPTEADGLPIGKLVITPERKGYENDALTLYIPTLEVTRVIHDGTDAETLNKGVGLFEYAQLPGEGNRNVSMAGHRNGLDKYGNITDRAPFYYVDQLKDGDYLYLYDSQHIYRYVYEYTEVVEPDDWGPIKTTGYSCLTITSCTPIGVSDHRIVIRAKLDEIFDYDKNYDFAAARPEEENP